MKLLTIAAIVLVTALASNAKSQFMAPPLRLVQTIPLPRVEGRIDHFTWDAKGQRLFLAALGNNTVEVIDLKIGRRVKTIKGLQEPQGVLFLPEFNQVAVANGKSGSVDFFDGTSLQFFGAVKLSDDADNMRYDNTSKLIYVGYGDGGLAVIDPKILKVTADIPLESHPESFQLETSRPRLYVNLPPNKIALVDKTANQTISTWSLRGLASANFPMALDEADHRLFIGSRQPAKLLVLDTESGKVIATMDTVDDADDIFYDKTHKRIYISGGGGSLNIFEQMDRDRYRVLSNVATAEGARTSFFVPETRRLYLAVPHQGKQKSEIRVYSVQP